MIIIGICGASGSGKSTLARKLKESLTCETYILGMDCYYRDYPEKSFEERVRINYDEPDAFDFDALYQDISELCAGHSIYRKAYDFNNYCRAALGERIAVPDVLLIEGLYPFYDERIKAKLSLKVYLHVDTDVCLLRRIKRDMRDRGRSIENISAQYLATVKPMYEQYISKSILEADFAVMRGGKNRMAIDAISAYISAKLLAEKFESGTEREGGEPIEG